MTFNATVELKASYNLDNQQMDFPLDSRVNYIRERADKSVSNGKILFEQTSWLGTKYYCDTDTYINVINQDLDGLECYVRGWFNPAWLNTIGLTQTNGPYQKCCKLARECLLLRQFEFLVSHAITKESGLLDHLRLKNSRTPLFLSSLYFVANEDVSSLAEVLFYEEPDNYKPSDPVEAFSYALASLMVSTRYNRWERRKDKETYWVARDEFRDYFISLGKIRLTQLQERISGELKSKQREISSIIKVLQGAVICFAFNL